MIKISMILVLASLLLVQVDSYRNQNKVLSLGNDTLDLEDEEVGLF